MTGYMTSYVSRVNDNDLIAALNNTLADTLELYGSVPADKETYRYGVGKWSIREVLGHVLDTERIFAYRALAIARGDKSQLPGYDQDAYVLTSNANDRSLNDLLTEFELLREGNIYMYEHFTEAMLDEAGNANNLTVTPRIIGFMIAGHNAHHNIILKERYW